MKTLALLAVRLGSSRLPGKAMMPILGKPMIEHMIERIRHAKSIDEIMIATTTNAADDALETLADRLGVLCFRGSSEDVLGRMSAAAASTDADLIVEMLGDNPLVHSELIDDVVAFYHEQGVDYAANVTVEYPHAGSDVAKFPVGIRVQAFSPAALATCNRLVTSPEHREHSTSYIYEHPETFSLAYLEAKGKWAALHRPELSFAVNYRANFELVKFIFEQAYPKNSNFSLHEVIKIWDANPQLLPKMGAQAA